MIPIVSDHLYGLYGTMIFDLRLLVAKAESGLDIGAMIRVVRRVYAL
jgi:hypothetical protein